MKQQIDFHTAGRHVKNRQDFLSFQEICTWVGRVSASPEHLLESQKVLLAHRAWLSVVLPASQLCELEGNDLQEEQGVGICPILLVGARRGNDTGLVPGHLIRGLGDEASVREDAGSHDT